MESVDTLPQIPDLSPHLLTFLEEKFQRREDLFKPSDIVSELQKQCSDLDQSLIDLDRRLESSVIKYASHSRRVEDLFDRIKVKLSDLRSSTCVSESFIDGREGEGLGREKQILGEELPALAKEVARVETVRIYAETALKLDTLVGDIEDAVSSTLMATSRKLPSGDNLEEKRLLAIKTLKLTEDVVASVTKTRPQWTHLVSAVDHRVDRALAILRPRAIADHRSLLASLGWPPPLSSLNSTNVNSEKSSEVLNPLFTMRGDLKKQYCDNFLALCSLQELQRQRKSRQLEGYNFETAVYQPLWAIEELVNPISLASEHHFSKWIETPEFIFALVYKITRDFVDSMDDLLQPLVDEARLVGYSCREEWISAMVTSLTTYLAKEIFPIYVEKLSEDGLSGPSQAKGSWLHLVDSMISFDKRIQFLIAHSGVGISLQEDDNLQRISSLSVFCDRPDWLELWAEIELSDISDKLKPEMENERNWKMKVHGASYVLGSEDYKSPAITGIVLQHLTTVTERCRSLPSISSRSKFIRLAGAPIIRRFLECLLQRCQEAEGLTALADDDALVKVTNSINAARYCESVLKEWSEDVFFLEMEAKEYDLCKMDEKSSSDIGTVEGLESGVFQEEIRKLEEFRTEWVEKISVVVLRGFDARCREYMKNKRQWQETGEEDWTVSRTFVGALDYLQGKVSKLGMDLDEIDFVVVWRSLANGVDRLVSSGILMSNAKFSNCGVERFRVDLEVLFGVFQAWCLRPEGFFPRVSEGLKLLKMDENRLRKSVEGGMERLLKENGIRHLGLTEAERILKNRVFIG